MNNDLVILSKSELMKLVINKDYQKDQLYVFTKEQLNELLNKAQVVNGEAVAWRVKYTSTGDWYLSSIELSQNSLDYIKREFKNVKIEPLFTTPQPAIPEGFMLAPIEQDKVKTTYAWMVVKYDHNKNISYAYMEDSGVEFSPNASEGFQFLRREDAERFASGGEFHDLRVEQHGFVGQPMISAAKKEGV